MRAIVIAEPGGPEVLKLREVPDPIPQRGEVRVRVRATAVNRADLLQRMGFYPAPPDAPADIPGLELAGEVDATGEGVTGLAPGDRVYGLVGGGAYAERVVAPARTLARIPEGLSFEDAAAVPEAFITAWDAMVAQAGLAAGDTALIHAAGSGVGTAGVQIARALGAKVVGTARQEDKLERARPLGLDAGVVPRGGKFAAEVLEKAGPVDVVLELVGGDYVSEDLECAATKARIVLVGLLAGASTDLNLALLLRKRVTLAGTALRARPLEEKIAATHLLARHIGPLLAQGRLRPIVDRVLPLSEAGEAHRLVAENTTFGKVVLALG